MSVSGETMIEHWRLIGSRLWRDSAAQLPWALETAVFGAGYVAAYVLGEWISNADYNMLANYSWNPNAGTTFAAVVMFGRRMIPFGFIAPLVAHIVAGQFALPLAYELVADGLIGGIYGAAALFLVHPKRGFDGTLQSMSSIVLLSLTAAVSCALVAAAHILVIIAAGQLTTADFTTTAVSHWVGDFIGTMVVTPVLLVLWSRRYTVWVSGQTLLQLAGIAAALAIAYIYWATEHLAFFYIIFVPVVWMAVRSGIEGVCLGILFTEVSFILGFHAFPHEISEMPKIQAFILVLSLTGLFTGGVVSERRRTEAVLRLHQESLGRLARLGSMGELAAALAHEINQPLLAAGTYTRLVADALRTGHDPPEAMAETAMKAATQVERAAAVVRRLRALVRLDRSNLGACRVDRIVRETIDLCQPDLDCAGLKIQQSVAAGLPLVMVDMLQIEQALLNLLRNSIDAIREAGRGTIAIEAALRDAGFVMVSVRDSGPGFPPDRAANPFLPLSSTKKEGLGVGLSLCRSLIEANGGRIWLGAGAPGASMHFTLPVAPVRSSRGVLS
jgi:two-component system, LuxR family, sensor kinase FixL